MEESKRKQSVSQANKTKGNKQQNEDVRRVKRSF